MLFFGSYQDVSRDVLLDHLVASSFQFYAELACGSLKVELVSSVAMEGCAPGVALSSGQSLLPSPSCCGGASVYVDPSTSASLSFSFVSC